MIKRFTAALILMLMATVLTVPNAQAGTSFPALYSQRWSTMQIFSDPSNVNQLWTFSGNTGGDANYHYIYSGQWGPAGFSHIFTYSAYCNRMYEMNAAGNGWNYWGTLGSNVWNRWYQFNNDGKRWLTQMRRTDNRGNCLP